MILAIDIGGTKLAASLIKDGLIIESRRTSTPKTGSQDDLANALKQLVTPLLPSARSVVVASTGIINGGRLTAVNPDNLGGLNNFPLQSSLESICNLPVSLLNDAQAAAWGEFCQLTRPCKSMAFITISTGVGAGLVINGELLTGTNGLAGHAGHMSLNAAGELCGCGRHGCVEAIASGSAIGKLAREIYKKEIDAKEVFEQFRLGDQDALKIVDRSAQAIATLLCNLKALLDIDTAVLGGSVGLAEGYLDRVFHYLKQEPELFQLEVTLAQLGHEAGLKGAALWLQNKAS